MKLSSRVLATQDAPRRKSSLKFIPNISQLQKAIKTLPDPELWPDPAYACAIMVDDETRTLEFVRKAINRGSSRAYRWIYEGKILVRKRDVA